MLGTVCDGAGPIPNKTRNGKGKGRRERERDRERERESERETDKTMSCGRRAVSVGYAQFSLSGWLGGEDVSACFSALGLGPSLVGAEFGTITLVT